MNLKMIDTNPPLFGFDLKNIAGEKLFSLPYSLRILLENTLRHAKTDADAQKGVDHILDWQPQDKSRPAVPFYPARILSQDLTGVPLIVDLAAMRSALARLGGSPGEITPKIPVDIVIDHSLQVDFHRTPDSMQKNIDLEYSRNRERYQLLRWAQSTFDNIRVVPPGKGIVHQINLENLATVITHTVIDGIRIALPDTVFGTDSHTPMINGLGVLGWGVGGIEAVGAMLGKPTYIRLPDVIGLAFHGSLPPGTTPTDLTLTIVERLRQEKVVGKFIECFGAGLDTISVQDRAMIANMAPESGATVIYFPIDDQTLIYLSETGRSPEQVTLVEKCSKLQALFRGADDQTPQFTKIIDINLDEIEPSIAGPYRPQDRLSITNINASFSQGLKKSRNLKGFSIPPNKSDEEIQLEIEGYPVTLRHGSLILAAITSCTNTSNPTVMLTAGLLAKKAVEKGLQISPAIKCSLMPGSKVVKAYLEISNLMAPLNQLGFNLVGFGCGSCIGNSGPLLPEIERALDGRNLVTASITSGNRNFEGRIHPLSKANYLASPPLVIAFALAGRVNIDLSIEAIGLDQNKNPVYLKDIYPQPAEVEQLKKVIQPQLFQQIYQDLYQGGPDWNSILSKTDSELYQWDLSSTYVKEPPYFSDIERVEQIGLPENITGARVLLFLGDSITTDHISPAGRIPLKSPAGTYLSNLGISESDFNTYGSRRGNDQVMTRGTFANIRLKNQLTPELEGGWTCHLPDGERLSVFEASKRYQNEKIPLIIIAGKEYGTGSSRDWAAKGPLLLGIRAVIAESFERIHRANLVGMGILPLTFLPGADADSLGLEGNEIYDISGLTHLTPGGTCSVRAKKSDGSRIAFNVMVQIETQSELQSFLKDGILVQALLENIGISIVSESK